MSVDPLAERRIWATPYNFVQNNPLIRIDPDGLTDYTLNRETGEVAQVGEANDKPDRILKTNRKGEVKTNKKGEAKVAIDNIEQGILSDGMNLKDDSHLIEVGGEGQPTENGVESFALKLSGYIGKEIGGAYFSKEGVNETTHMTIGRYAGNDGTSTKDFGNNLSRYFADKTEIYNYTERGLFHTHPDLSVGSKQHKERFIPSDDDIRIRNDALRRNPNLQFFILTNPRNTGDKFPLKIPYTKD